MGPLPDQVKHIVVGGDKDQCHEQKQADIDPELLCPFIHHFAAHGFDGIVSEMAAIEERDWRRALALDTNYGKPRRAKGSCNISQSGKRNEGSCCTGAGTKSPRVVAEAAHFVGLVDPRCKIGSALGLRWSYRDTAAQSRS
jgi:hypothetical protein